MQPELVSVIVCVYNAGRYLLPSVSSVLEQTHRELDIIIVDDGSTDGCTSSLSALSDPRIRIYTQVNRGKPAALNLALDHARGAYYAVHDADDISHPRRIETQLSCLRRHPQLAGVFCGHELILEDRNIAPTFEEKDEQACRRDIERMRMPAHDPTGMYRMALVADVRYDEALPVVEGYDYIMRVGEQHPLRVVGECLYGYRIHLKSVTRRNPARRDALLQAAVSKTLARRRGPADANEGPFALQPLKRRNDNDLVSHFISSVVDCKRSSELRQAARSTWASISLCPSDISYYKPVLYLLAPLGAIDGYRRMKSIARPAMQ